MGNCNRPSSHRRILPSCLPEAANLSYPSIAALNITAIGRKSPFIEFPLSGPIGVENKRVVIGRDKVVISECTLPGADPINGLTKLCKDACFTVTDTLSLFLGVIDGHGTAGKEVASFCRKKSLSLFTGSKSSYIESPRKFLEDVIKSLDSDIKSQSIDFDTESSGCTLSLLLLYEKTLYIACVGDVKAIIGTNDLGNRSITEVRAHPLGYQDYIDRSRQVRSIQLDYPIHPLKVSIDKRPEDMTEVVRIVRAGGRVHRNSDAKKTTPGPMRVWRGEMGMPGLMVSRAIGDRENADLGICSEPELSEYYLRPDLDFFLVVGSSGLWEIMEDCEVVRFVEKYRETSLRSGNSAVPASGSQSSISHLLCEEARMRWLPVLEQEAIALPDISAVIIEFNTGVERD